MISFFHPLTWKTFRKMMNIWGDIKCNNIRFSSIVAIIQNHVVLFRSTFHQNWIIQTSTSYFQYYKCIKNFIVLVAFIDKAWSWACIRRVLREEYNCYPMLLEDIFPQWIPVMIIVNDIEFISYSKHFYFDDPNRSVIKGQASQATSDYKWPRVTTSDYKWLRATTSDYEWLHATTSDYGLDYEWLQVITSDYNSDQN